MESIGKGEYMNKNKKQEALDTEDTDFMFTVCKALNEMTVREKENFKDFAIRVINGEKFTNEEIDRMAREGVDSVPYKGCRLPESADNQRSHVAEQ